MNGYGGSILRVNLTTGKIIHAAHPARPGARFYRRARLWRLFLCSKKSRRTLTRLARKTS